MFSSVLLSALKLGFSVNKQLNRWKRSETKGKHYLIKMVSACYQERVFKGNFNSDKDWLATY